MSIHAERAQGCSGGQPQDFQRSLEYLSASGVVNEEVQRKGVTEGSSQPSAVSHQVKHSPAAFVR